jgi:hypothetical protein
MITHTEGAVLFGLMVVAAVVAAMLLRKKEGAGG